MASFLAERNCISYYHFIHHRIFNVFNSLARQHWMSSIGPHTSCTMLFQCRSCGTQGTSRIDQVIDAMEEINKATEQFVTATEQTKQSTKNLNGVADDLQASVSGYKLNEEEN